MNIRPLLPALILAIAAVGHAKRNVLLVMADDFNFWLGRTGYHPLVKTPNLDRLSRRGVLFRQAFSASPVCNPSRNAMWSGYRPSTTGIDNNQGGYVRDVAGFANITTLNQHFTNAGWYTMGGGKLYHPGTMGDRETDPSNWSELYKGASGSPGGTLYKYAAPSNSLFSWSAGTFDLASAGDTKLATTFAKRIADWPSSAQRGKPFFLGVGLFRPHLPLNVHKMFWDLFDTAAITLPRGYKAGDLSDIPGASPQTEFEEIRKAGLWKRMIHAYLAGLAYADYNAGILLDALDASPLKDSTIVVFVGDHGWHLGEKERFAKYAVYGQANRTTLLIVDPLAKGNGKICDVPVSMQDLYPTLSDLAGAPRNEAIEGRSLRSLLDDPETLEDRPAVMTYAGTNMVQTRRWRFVDDGTKSQLYDLVADPDEWTNLYGKTGTSATVAALRKSMDSVIAIGTRLKANGLKPPTTDANRAGSSINPSTTVHLAMPVAGEILLAVPPGPNRIELRDLTGRILSQRIVEGSADGNASRIPLSIPTRDVQGPIVVRLSPL